MHGILDGFIEMTTGGNLADKGAFSGCVPCKTFFKKVVEDTVRIQQLSTLGESIPSRTGFRTRGNLNFEKCGLNNGTCLRIPNVGVGKPNATALEKQAVFLTVS